jgi:hypothetical protein
MAIRDKQAPSAATSPLASERLKSAIHDLASASADVLNCSNMLGPLTSLITDFDRVFSIYSNV